MLEPYFVQQVTKMALKRSSYGDLISDPNGEDEVMYCRIRPFVESARFDAVNEEERMPVMIAWFSPTANVNPNDIFLWEGGYYEVVRVREARRLGGSKIQFLKVSLNKHVTVS